MEDDLNFLKMEDNLTKIIQQKTTKIKAKNKTMVVAPLQVT
jgi:hypothetical protein